MKKDANERTTISITVATRDRLRGTGRFGETFDQLIRRLLDASG